MPDSPAVYVSIGNSDDTLRQRDWATFIADLRDAMEHHVEIQGIWHSAPDSPYQNVCVCGTVPADVDDAGTLLDSLRRELAELRDHYRQDSIALAVVDRTEFV